MRPQSYIGTLLILAGSTIFPAPALLSQESIWNSIRSEKEYFQQLADADSAVFRNNFEMRFTILLDYEQEDNYARRETLEEKKEFIRSYWKRENPAPLLEQNPWLVSYIMRNHYIEKYYSIPDPPYFDDRGKFYLKYGPPRDKYIDYGGPKIAPLLSGSQNYSLNNAGNFAGDDTYSLFPNETWSYENIGEDLVVDFVKTDSKYHEVESFTRALINTGRTSRKIKYWWEILKKRSYVSRMLTEVHSDVLQDPQTRVTRKGLEPHPLVAQRFMEVTIQRENLGKFLAPPIAPDAEISKRKMGFGTSVAQFQGPGSSTRVEIFFLTPVVDNLIDKDYLLEKINDDEAEEERLDIEYSSMVRDTNFVPVIQAKNRKNFPVETALAAELPFAVGSLTLITPPLNGELATQVRNMKSGKLGYAKDEFAIRNFDGDDLMISDLQFYMEVENTNQQKALPSYVKHGFLVSPYPYLEVHASTHLLVYFEIYNLVSSGMPEDYKIEINVARDQKRRSRLKKVLGFFRRGEKYSVSTVQDRKVTKNNDFELLSLDLSDVRSGPHTFSISVYDSDKKLTATAVKNIFIANEKEQ